MKRICSFFLSSVLLIILCTSAAASNISLSASVDSGAGVLHPGDSITYLVTVKGASNAEIEGMAFHVLYTDGLAVESSSVKCSDLFMMSGYNAENSLFSTVIAKNTDGVCEESWEALELVFKVKGSANGAQSISIANPSDDEKWQLFNISYEELTCDTSAAYVSLKIQGGSEEGNKQDNDQSAVTPPNNASSFVDNTGSSEGKPSTPGTTSQTDKGTQSSSESDDKEDSLTSGNTTVYSDSGNNTASVGVITGENEDRDSMQTENSAINEEGKEVEESLDSTSPAVLASQEDIKNSSHTRFYILFASLGAAIVCVIIAVVSMMRKRRH